MYLVPASMGTQKQDNESCTITVAYEANYVILKLTTVMESSSITAGTEHALLAIQALLVALTFSFR
jgi:hypothetical protein